MRSDSEPSSDNFVDLIHRCDEQFESSETLQDFAQQVLRIAVDSLPVSAAAIIEFAAQRPKLFVEQSLINIVADGMFRFDPEHLNLIAKSFQQQGPQIAANRFQPDSGLKKHTLVVTPLPGEPLRALELYQLDHIDEGQLPALKEAAGILANYLNRFEQNRLARLQPAITVDFWKQLDPFLIRLQQTLDQKQTVAIAVNDGRFLIGCDRVSIALRHGAKTRIAGVSGQESIQHRATLVKLLNRVSNAVMKLGQPVLYRGRVEEVPPQLEVTLVEYLTESRTRMIQFIPLREPAPLLLDDDYQTKKPVEADRKLLGFLIIEQATESRPRPGVLERAELIGAHVETALANCERQESILLLPLLRGMGRALRWFRGRRFWTAVAVLATLLLTGLGLWIIPWEYRVEGEGLAMPVVQHEIFAPWDADVKEIYVESGQRVKAGDLLLQLESDDLLTEEITVSNELLEKQKYALALTQQQHAARRKNDQDELAKLEAEFVKTKVEVDGAAARLAKIRERITKLRIVAPVEGVVATFQLRQLLQNRPVRRGEMLLQVMDPTGPWRLELEIPEYRMGHLLQAMQKSDAPLTVDYVLATAVEKSHQGKLTTIATRTNESEPDGTTVQAYVEINPEDLGLQSMGAEVIAKVHCGKKSLYHVLFGDVIEFIQRKVWL